MKKPTLIMSASEKPSRQYADLFTLCGFSVHIEYLPTDFDADGLVLCGGGDVDPHRYGEEYDGSAPADSRRDECEFRLLEAYYRRHKPIFGICRGIQVLNIGLGGTLYQHLPTAAAHSMPNNDCMHTVLNVADTPAWALYGESVTVNSFHHQGCRKIGEGLSVMQQHTDGTVEGLYGKNLLAVQWHPERMSHEISTPLVRHYFEMFS